MLRVALTGGIASGKSTVARLFAELGVPVIDMDKIARDVVQPGTAGLNGLVALFGPDILDQSGVLQRDQLRELIFSESRAREQVNQLLHPLILQETERQLSRVDAPYAFVEVPLLAETKLAHQFDRVLVVDVPPDVQLQRLIQRDGVAPDQAQRALDAQASRTDRLAVATEVIANTDSLESLRARVAEQHEHYLELAKRFASAAKRPSE